MQVVLNVKGSSRTIGSGHNREVAALYRWPQINRRYYLVHQCSIAQLTIGT